MPNNCILEFSNHTLLTGVAGAILVLCTLYNDDNSSRECNRGNTALEERTRNHRSIERSPLSSVTVTAGVSTRTRHAKQGFLQHPERHTE